MTEISSGKKFELKKKSVENKREPFSKYIRTNFALYTMVLPGVILLVVFCYFPMYGITMAFQNFKPSLGFFGSPYVGLKHFIRLVTDPYFFLTFKNTILLGFYSLLFGFPAPIILALLFNEIKNSAFKRITQSISYMPYFLSTVIVVGIMRDMMTVNDGVVNNVIQALGGGKIDFFTSANWFRIIFISSGLWQGIGFSSIIYLAAISGVDPGLYESAVLDGASRFKQAVHITIPCILPTIVILFIFAVGGILGSDFQKILLMYNPSIYSTADVISTYIYRAGIEGASQSYSAAVGLFMSVISVVLLAITNFLAKRFGETSLW